MPATADRPDTTDRPNTADRPATTDRSDTADRPNTTDRPATADRSDAAELVHSLLRSYPDFPRDGIIYRDLAPVFAAPGALRSITAQLLEDAIAPGRSIDAVAGVESRGFTIAAAIAERIGCGMLSIRKAGKLPGETLSESYALEYGNDVLQLQPDTLQPGSTVLIVDDLLATGGTLAAAARLVERAGYALAGIGVVLELDGLRGRELPPGLSVTSITTV